MNAVVVHLERVLAAHSSESLPYKLARAKLDAFTGDIPSARSALEKLLKAQGDQSHMSEFVLANIVHTALLTLQLDMVADVLNRHFDTGSWFRIAYEDRNPALLTTIGLRIDGKASALFTLCDKLRTSERFDFVANRWLFTLPLFAAYYRRQAPGAGRIKLNMEDHGVAPGLAFCDHRPEFFLVPDPPFLSSRGYEAIRDHYKEHHIDWQARRPVAFWRGSTSGRMVDRAIGWRSLPRIRLCEIARDHREHIDAGITQVVQIADASAEEEVKASGLLADFVPAEDFNKYRYQIDIDGNTNSWPGLFQKLLTGSPVLKVASREGFRQWYYDLLKPWVNFIPIIPDMSDLVEKVQWLAAHDDTAHTIGSNGQALAESLSYASEAERASPVIDAALRFFSGQPETILQFVNVEKGNAVPSSNPDGSQNTGVAVSGWESRFELPRPIAGGDFVLTLDVAPIDGQSLPSSQRLTVVANGEIIRQAALTAATRLHCHLPHRVLDRSEKLVVTLLHPDAACGASADRPLDTRILSVALQRLTLTPASLHQEEVAEGLVVGDAPTRPSRQGAVMHALYGRDVWRGFVPSRTRVPEVQGWNGRHPVFGRLLDEVANKTMIDVAVWKGQSTIFVAELMRQRGIDGCIVAVDTFLAEEHWPAEGKLFSRHPGGRPDVQETFLDNVHYAGVADLVVPLMAPPIAAAGLLRQRGIRAGIIHLDASREYAELSKHADAYWRLLEPGGYLVGDDYAASWPGVIQAASEFAAKLKLELDIQPPKWLLRKPAQAGTEPMDSAI